MAVTRLKRKDRRNYARQKNKLAVIKQLTFKPSLKKVTAEELKAEFESTKGE
jgi:hypothetical protein